MAFDASNHPRSDGGKAIPSQEVFFQGHRLKVFWVDADPNATEVVKGQSVWDWANVELVNETMSDPNVTIGIDSPVSTSVWCPKPQPTGLGLVDSA